MKFCEIASILNRDQRTIWVTYNEAIKKLKDPFEKDKKGPFVPVEKFNTRKFAVLEILCNSLIEQGFPISEISNLLKKHRNTVWTAYSRFKKKNA